MFNLDRPNSDSETFIFLRLRCTDGRLKYPVKEKVHKDNWDPVTERIRKDRTGGNIILNKIDLAVQALQHESKLKGRPLTRAWITQALDRLLGRQGSGNSFYEAIEKIIDDRESGAELTKDGKRFSAETLKSYRQSFNKLREFDPGLTFESITLKTYDKILEHYNKKDLSTNSLGKLLKNLKVFLKAAHKRGYHENLIYAHEDFRVPEEDTEDIHLEEQELERIYRHNFINPTLDLVRDWFIIDCYTGLRISDIQMIGKQNLTKDFIQIANEKTDTRVVIPLHPYVRAILKKHKGLPRKISDQKMNESIKKVCELAGINEVVLFSITKGGVRKDFYYKKYEMVSNHTARRSFITNLLDAGVPDNQVMDLAGIKKHGTLMKYKKSKKEKTAAILAGHRFFKGEK